MSDIFGRYIPDYRYEVVRLQDFSEKELVGFGNELSLVMLVNKLKDSGDFKKLREIPKEYFENLEKSSPEYLLNLISTVIAVFMHKLNVPKEEIAEFTDSVRERKIAMLFENFEAYDVHETRRVSREEGRLEGKLEGKAEDIMMLLAEYGTVPKELEDKLREETNLDTLRKWLRIAAQSGSIKEFEEKIE